VVGSVAENRKTSQNATGHCQWALRFLLAFATTPCTARSVAMDPSNLRTRLRIFAFAHPARDQATICARLQTSKRACSFTAVLPIPREQVMQRGSFALSQTGFEPNVICCDIPCDFMMWRSSTAFGQMYFEQNMCFCEKMCRRSVPPRAKLNFAKFAPYFNVGVPFGKVQSPRWAEPTLKYGAGRAKLSFARGWWIAHPIVCSGSASRRKSNIYVNTGTFANRVYPGGRLTKNNLM
jgi:hypothetical protein